MQCATPQPLALVIVLSENVLLVSDKMKAADAGDPGKSCLDYSVLLCLESWLVKLQRGNCMGLVKEPQPAHV